MPNNRHRQIEKFRKAELLRARREFEAKGYDWDKTVEAFQKLGVEFLKAAGTIAEAIRKVQE